MAMRGFLMRATRATLLGFPRWIKRWENIAKDGVEATGNQGSHVKLRTKFDSATADGAFGTTWVAIAGKRGDTDPSSQLLEIEPISGKRQLRLKAVWKPTPLIEQRCWSVLGDEGLKLLVGLFDLGLEVS
jgi:hypothetical protein